MIKSEKKIGWIEEIAKKSKCSQDEVKRVMDKYDIRQSPTVGSVCASELESI
jgi:hypothetical protein